MVFLILMYYSNIIGAMHEPLLNVYCIRWTHVSQTNINHVQ